MRKQKRKTTLKVLVKVFIAGAGIVAVFGLLYHYMVASSADTITHAKENEMALSRNVSVSTETLFATNFESSVEVIVESERIEESQTATIETGEVCATEKPKKIKLIQKKKTMYISIEGYRKNMDINMDISHPSGLSKKDFIRLAKEITTKLPEKDPNRIFKKEASFIWHLGQKYQVDEIALLAIIAHESGWASYDLAIKRNNFTGQMAGEKLDTYRTVRENLEATARNLRENYLKKRKNLFAINKKYCEPVDGEYTWYIGVYGCMKKIVDK